MPPPCKYTLYDCDQLIGIYSADEISNITGMKVRAVPQYASSGYKFAGRYFMESEGRIWRENWKADWDETRKEKLKLFS